jgi:polysaccharide biosynthesis protein PslH
VKILFLQIHPLFPTDTGGKIRTLNVLRHLSRWHDVTYLCHVRPGEERYCADMAALGLRIETVERTGVARGSLQFYSALARNLFSPLPFSSAKNYDPALQQRAKELLARDQFDLVICDFIHTALYAVGLDGPAKVLFQHNVEAQILKRHAANSPGRFLRRYMALQGKRMFQFEGKIGREFDAIIAVSDQDRQRFESDYGWKHVGVIDTGVDLEYFAPGQAAERPGRVLFVGSLDWLPNQYGVRWFVEQVWPLIRQANPSTQFQVVGRKPPRDILALGAVDGVQIVGTVPDVRPYLAESAVVVVPLAVGGGTRLKIFEAMSMGKVIVSTTVGCEGLPVVPGRHLLVEDQPERFARAVLQLLDRPAERAELGTAARELVCEHFGAETIARQFEHICQDVVERRRPGRHTVVERQRPAQSAVRA